MKTKFIFSFVNRDENGIYRDMTSSKADGIIDFLPSHKVKNNIIARKVEQVLLSSRFQNTPITPIFQNYYANLDSYPYNDDTTYFILMPSTSVGKLSTSYLESFARRHRNVKLFPILTDSIHASSPHMEYVRPKLNSPAWDRVLTFDKNDASEFGYTWFGYTWYSTFDEIVPSNERTDLFYVGYKKGNREHLIAEIYDAAINEGVNCDFRIVSSEVDEIIKGSKLKYTNQRFKYPELISTIKSSNCLLEVLQEGQETQTIKYYEAVCYGKKLLTNNKNLYELPYYNDATMKYFETVSDIDWKWIKDDSTVEYNYQGEFSPLRIVDFLKELYDVEKDKD